MNISELNGFILINKPAGITSFDVIRQLRRQTGIRSFGHAGTLDPFATGLLIVAVNKYTRLLPLMDNWDKTYIASLLFGIETNTGDPEGDITSNDDTPVDITLLELVPSMVQNLKKLKPHKFSAVKINGQKAYDKARKYEDFELSEKDITIHDFKILSYDYPLLKYHCRVSKGTYIRSLSIKIAEFLGTVGHTINLCRIAIGDINIESASNLRSIDINNFPRHLFSAEKVFPDMPKSVLSDNELIELRQGRNIEQVGIDEPRLLIFDKNGQCHGIAGRFKNRLNPKVNL